MATSANGLRTGLDDVPAARRPTASGGVELQDLAGRVGGRVLAGGGGSHRPVERVELLDDPGELVGVRPGDLVVVSTAALRAASGEDADLVAGLRDNGAVGLAVRSGAVAAPLLAEADRVGLPVVALPAGLSLGELMAPLLHPSPAPPAVDRAEEVHRALLQIVVEGGGLAEVAEGLVGLLGGAVVVTTPDGRVLASAGEARDLDRTLGGGCFDPSGRFRTEQESVGLSAHPQQAGNHVLVRITAGRFDHGRIVAFSPAGTLTPGDVPTVERAATVAALAVTKQLAVRAVESKYQADFLRDLLGGQVDAEVGVAHAASLGWDVDRPVVVVVAELDPGEGEEQTATLVTRPAGERFAAAWQSVVRPRDPRAAVVGFHREVVALLGVPAHGDVDRLVRELVREVSGDGGGGRRSFGTGVSRVAPAAGGIPQAYEQARTAVRVGRRVQGRGALAHFDALGVFRLLSSVQDAAELRAFAEEALGPLARTDGTPAERQEAADLRHTLEVLLDANLNVAHAARQLHFHYNTLRYRIAKLERLLGPFVEDPQLRLSLHLALHVLRMHDA